MALHKMVSMKRSKKDRERNTDHTISESHFPHGLTINLDDESLTKLGIKELPAVGEQMIVAGIGRVESVSQHNSERRATRSVSIQLEKLEVDTLAGGSPSTAEDAVSEAIKDV